MTEVGYRHLTPGRPTRARNATGTTCSNGSLF